MGHVEKEDMVVDVRVDVEGDGRMEFVRLPASK
jgi:hypothetical protein